LLILAKRNLCYRRNFILLPFDTDAKRLRCGLTYRFESEELVQSVYCRAYDLVFGYSLPRQHMHDYYSDSSVHMYVLMCVQMNYCVYCQSVIRIVCVCYSHQSSLFFEYPCHIIVSHAKIILRLVCKCMYPAQFAHSDFHGRSSRSNK
jgi:hypothetical protein